VARNVSEKCVVHYVHGDFLTALNLRSFTMVLSSGVRSVVTNAVVFVFFIVCMEKHILCYVWTVAIVLSLLLVYLLTGILML